MSIPETDPAMAEAPRPRRRLVSWVFGAVALSALIGSIWYAYEHGLRRAGGGPPPLIKAEPGPSRVKPDEPGGLKVPFQDQTIYKEIEKKTDKPPVQQGERLLPPPEQALPKPKPEPVVVAPPPPPPPAPAPVATPIPAPAAAPAPPPPPPAPPAPTVAAVPVAPVIATPAPTPAPAPPPAPPAPTTTAAAAPPASPTTSPKPGAPISLIPPTTPPPAAASAPAPAPLPPLTPVAPTTPAPATVAKAAPAPPPPSSSNGTGIRVQLGAFGDQPSAEKAWSQLKSAHSDVLAGAGSSITEFVPGEGKRAVYRLQAGPFADLAGARSACVTLKSRKVDCIVRP